MPSREVTIEAQGEAPATPAYLAMPATLACPRYGVVVIHEMFGRAADIDRACDRIARVGAAALAPDLSARGRLMCLVDMFRALRTGEGTAVAQTLAAREWLMRETSLGVDRIALLGFCIGGGFVLAAGRGWAAISTNYGEVPALERLEGLGPVVGCYGARDRQFGKNAAVLDERLTRLGIRHDVHSFPEAGHSFLTDGHHPIARILLPKLALGAGSEAREEGWSKIFAFFDSCFGEDKNLAEEWQVGRPPSSETV